MKNKNLLILIILSFALLIPFPGRLGYGIIMILMLNLLMCFGTLFKKLISILKIEEFQDVLVSVFLVFLSVLAKLILNMINAQMSLVLSYCIYIPALCSVLIASLYNTPDESISEQLKKNMIKSGVFSIFAFVFFMFRDIFGYGTLTFPSLNGLYVIPVFKNGSKFIIGNFWATIPGAMVLVAFLIVIISHINDSLLAAEKRLNKGEKNVSE